MSSTDSELADFMNSPTARIRNRCFNAVLMEMFVLTELQILYLSFET